MSPALVLLSLVVKPAALLALAAVLPLAAARFAARGVELDDTRRARARFGATAASAAVGLLALLASRSLLSPALLAPPAAREVVRALLLVATAALATASALAGLGSRPADLHLSALVGSRAGALLAGFAVLAALWSSMRPASAAGIGLGAAVVLAAVLVAERSSLRSLGTGTAPRTLLVAVLVAIALLAVAESLRQGTLASRSAGAALAVLLLVAGGLRRTLPRGFFRPTARAAFLCLAVVALAAGAEWAAARAGAPAVEAARQGRDIRPGTPSSRLYLALGASPESPGALVALGDTWLAAKDAARARRAFEAALDARHGWAPAVAGLGIADSALGRDGDSVGELHAALSASLLPEEEERVLYTLATTLRRRGDEDGADEAGARLQMLREARGEPPGAPE